MSDPIDPTRDAYGTTYTAGVGFTGSEGQNVVLTATINTYIDGGQFVPFTAQDAETLLLGLCQAFRDQIAPASAGAIPTPVTFNIQAFQSASASLT